MEEKKSKAGKTYLVDFGNDDELRKQVKIFTAKEGISIKQLIVDCLKEKIGYNRKE